MKCSVCVCVCVYVREGGVTMVVFTQEGLTNAAVKGVGDAMD